MNKLSDADRVLIAFVLSLAAMIICRHNGAVETGFMDANKILIGGLCVLAQQDRKQ